MSDGPENAAFESMPPVDALAEHLLEAAAIGRFAEELALASAALDALSETIDAGEILRYRVLFFDLALVSTANRRLQAEMGVELLNGASEDAWDAILHTARVREIQLLAGEPVVGLELVELLSYAPDAGIRDFAIAELEAVGMRSLAADEDARSVERLLHASGESDAAYRLEAERKRRATTRSPSPVRRIQPVPTVSYGVVAIAGGHAQLRGAAAALLDRYGVTVIPIPSSQEAVRRERDVLQSLQGCDLAVVLVRQITHSTSDQVRRAADRLGIPVMFSDAASAVAIERQLVARNPSR